MAIDYSWITISRRRNQKWLGGLVRGPERTRPVSRSTLAAAVMRAGLIDEYAIVTHPVLVGGGTPFFTALDNWVNLNLVETRTFPDGVLLTRYKTRR
jgi:hypothetical protein